MGYPSRDEELCIIERFSAEVSGDKVTEGQAVDSVLTPQGLKAMREAAATAKMTREVSSYLLTLVENTRRNESLSLGVSPRGALYLARLAKASAALDGRDFVVPDDIKGVAVACLAHRVTPKSEASVRGRTQRDIIERILDETPVPVESAEDAQHGG
jgi:MoxR-like ATPase